jgi:hypothetical protein
MSWHEGNAIGGFASALCLTALIAHIHQAAAKYWMQQPGGACGYRVAGTVVGPTYAFDRGKAEFPHEGCGESIGISGNPKGKCAQTICGIEVRDASSHFALFSFALDQFAYCRSMAGVDFLGPCRMNVGPSTSDRFQALPSMLRVLVGLRARHDLA